MSNYLHINVLIVEYSGYSLYDGETSDERIFDDAEQIMLFLNLVIKIPQENIILVGRSLGSAPAIKCAVNYKAGMLV